jgi:WD40 repeat protein
MQSQAWRLILSLLFGAATTATPRPVSRSISSEMYLGLGHTEPVTALAWSPDGRTLATASTDHTVILWDVAARRPRATLTGYTRPEIGYWYAPPLV